jgi:hypothetical protein
MDNSRADEWIAPAGARRRRTLAAALLAAALFRCEAAAADEPHVLFLRGWFGVFSTGMDTMAGELRNKGIKAEVAGHLHWGTAVETIISDRSAGKTGPIVLVGHSQGANNVIDMARKLQARKIPVDLLITLAPLNQDPIPVNVARAVNFYQSPGWGAPLAPERGFRGTISNVNVPDITVTHITIDKSAKVQEDVVREVTAAVRGKSAAAPKR